MTEPPEGAHLLVLQCEAHPELIGYSVIVRAHHDVVSLSWPDGIFEGELAVMGWDGQTVALGTTVFRWVEHYPLALPDVAGGKFRIPGAPNGR